MAEISSPAGPAPFIPDNLTLPQFFLDSLHPLRPTRTAGQPWLIDDQTGKEVGFEEIRARTFGLANGLNRRVKFEKEGVVCIFGPNHIDYGVVVWAAHRLGQIVTCANPAFLPEELANQLTATKAQLLVVHPDIVDAALSAARIAGIPQDRIILFDDVANPTPSPSFPSISQLVTEGLSATPSFVEVQFAPNEAKSKVAFICFSSGTTGKPKGVLLSHYAVIATILQTAAHQKVNENYTTWDKRRFRPGDAASCVMPMFHLYGMMANLHFTLFSGLTVVVTKKFDFVEFLKSIVKYRITHLFLVPPMMIAFCQHPAVKQYDLSHIRFCVAGAAPVAEELIQQFTKVLPETSFGLGFGLTEAGCGVSFIPVSQKVGRPGSSGELIHGVVARVVKPDGSLAKLKESGELIVKSPSVALGYLNDEKATSEAFKDGWVHTGDEVYLDERGEVFVVDRIKELIKVRGFQVAPAELEGHLLDHPDVSEACVVGILDDYSGELPLAFVQLKPAAAARIAKNPQEAEAIKASISKYVSDSKVYYKRLAGGVEFIDAVPKTPSGKILRRVLRDDARAARKAVKAKL